MRLVCTASKVAKPYFDWLAEQAVTNSKLNVVNCSAQLFERFQYFCDSYTSKRDEAERRKGERIRTPAGEGFTIRYPAVTLFREAKWLALAAIDSFFSWTEHVFIMIAILQGGCERGDQVAELAVADWSVKFKAALDISNRATKRLSVTRDMSGFLRNSYCS